MGYMGTSYISIIVPRIDQAGRMAKPGRVRGEEFSDFLPKWRFWVCEIEPPTHTIYIRTVFYDRVPCVEMTVSCVRGSENSAPRRAMNVRAAVEYGRWRDVFIGLRSEGV